MNRHLLASLLIIVLTALCVGPTLTWQEFSNGPENLVVATAQEMRRGGAWLAPTLQGELRWQKPPVANWITAAAIRPRTMREISTADRLTRRTASVELAREVRWPALLAACAMLLGIFALGNVLGGSRIGLLATAVAASSFFFLRFCRYATTDIYLALCVTWINVLLARAVLRRATWLNCIGAGALLGIAIMTKGPVAIAQTVVPIAAFMAWRAFVARSDSPVEIPARLLIAGAVVALLLGLPWWFYVFYSLPHAAWRFQAQLTGIGMSDSPDPWYSYFYVIVYVMPFSAFFVVGLIQFAQRLIWRKADSLVVGGMLLAAPIAVMIFFRERHDRYLLPMLGPAACVIAFAIREHLDARQQCRKEDRILATVHWGMIAFAIVAFLICATLGKPHWMTRLDDGAGWYSRGAGAALGAAGLLIAGLGALLHRRRRGALVTFTLIVSLAAQAVVVFGFVQSEAGRSDMRALAEEVVERYPNAIAYNAHPKGKRPATDLGVYLNRQVTWVADPSVLRAGDRPIVLFIPQDAHEPPPVAGPGWIYIDKAAKRKDWWHAFVLPAQDRRS